MDRELIERTLAGVGSVSQSQAKTLADTMSVEKIVEVPYAATVTLDASQGDVFRVGTLTNNITFAAPINGRAGQVITILMTQGGTNRTVTWNSAFKKANDGTSTANQRTAAQFMFDGAAWQQLGGAVAWNAA